MNTVCTVNSKQPFITKIFITPQYVNHFSTDYFLPHSKYLFFNDFVFTEFIPNVLFI